MKTKNLSLPRITLASACILLPATISLAETETAEEVFNLSPFEVRPTEDRGYLVSETTSATRFAVDRRDLPFSITSLSSDLLEEIHAVDAI